MRPRTSQQERADLEKVDLLPYSQSTPDDPYELIVWHGYNGITCELCQKGVSISMQVIPCKDCHFYRHVSVGDRYTDSYDGEYLPASLYRISPSGVMHIKLTTPHRWHSDDQAMCGRKPRT